MPRPAFRFPISGFTLVDLIITVMLLVSLAGIGGFYYQEFKDSQRVGVATNELDALAKAVQAYELTTSSAVDDRLVSRFTSRGFPPLHFLVEAGSLPSIPSDPWGRDYQIDPSRGILYSMGPKGPAEGDLSGTDDIKRAYKKEVASDRRSLLKPEQGLQVDDRQAPVITVVEPIGTLDRDNPPIRCAYYDNPGGSIVVSTGSSAPKKPKLFIDGEDADDLVPAQGRLTRSISQMVYTTLGHFSEDEHIVVAQVEDGSGNIARRQWKFTVELSRMSVKWLQPLAAQVRGVTNIAAAIDNGGRQIGGWTLFMDSRELVSGGKDQAMNGSEVMLIPSGGLPALDTKTLADGAHPLMLRVSSRTGHVEEWRTSLNVDNTPPSIRQILNKTTAGQSCLQAQRITTTVPDVGGQASDNFSVRNVTYQYFSVDQATGSTVGAVMTEPSTAIPSTWSPKTNKTHREDNPGGLYNSADVTFYTVPRPNSSDEFKPVTLPQGLYQVKFQAFDEAGNGSTARTTCFFVDLQKGGIKGQAFLDATAARCGQSFSEDQKHIHGSMATAGLAVTQETSGQVEFSILDEGKTPISTWEVIIDDNGTGGRPDGQFQKSANPRDWSTSGSFLGKSAGTLYKTGLYVPDGSADSLRRGNDTTASPIPEGPLVARIRYVSDTGTTYTTTTTFLVDNSLPVPAGLYGFAAKQSGTVQALREGDILLQSSPTGAPLDGGLEFGGIFSDRPTQGVVREIRWSLLKDGALFPGRNNISCFPFPGSPCTTNTASFGVVAGLGQLDSGSMNISTGVVGGLDGIYKLSLSVADGAGLTTRPVINFSVDLLPPEVLALRIFKAGGAAEGILAEVPCSQGPGTLTTCDGQALRFTPIVRDQFPVREVHYWLVPVTDPPTLKSAAVVIPITGTSSFPAIPEQVVVRDTRNSPLRPLPQVYELQVEAVGTHRTDPGPLCSTRVAFRYLTNLAVFAPFDAQSTLVQATLPADRSTARTWLSSQEQADLASYLNSAFSAGSTQIFDYSGRTSRVGSLLKLTDWLSQNSGNGTTDVLVLLDSAPRGAI
ncbi:MAG: hypothetical protein HY814_02165, partial [Candidatus Riflebacteria bacterium]|nr:hypothetical protein [Candidatus Riflebacteria bacterium]